jgi:hypothetical protein
MMTAIGTAARNGTSNRDMAVTVRYPPAIAKTPCDRLTKRIKPRVTESPTARRYRTMP